MHITDHTPREVADRSVPLMDTNPPTTQGQRAKATSHRAVKYDTHYKAGQATIQRHRTTRNKMQSKERNARRGDRANDVGFN